MSNKNSWLILSPEAAVDEAVTFKETVASWMHRPISVGDDQGRHGACAIFSFAEWAELMHGVSITDEDCIRLYKATLQKLGLPSDSGLTFYDAYEACAWAGWLPNTNTIRRTNNLSELNRQPILVGVKVTDALYNVASNGCLDHEASSQTTGYHAMLCLRCGKIEQTGTDTEWVVLKNHWTSGWGYKGMGICTKELFQDLVREMWLII